MTRPVVAVVKYEDAYDSLKKAIEMSDGLADFKQDDKILIKPNIVEWDFELPFPPFGVVPTSKVMSALVRILAEHGFRNLTIGEGTPLPYAKGKGHAVFKALGYEKLKQDYGVQLVDTDEEEFQPVDFGEFELSIAKRALEADKIVTLPALKAHGSCKVSLGIKNVKGLIARKSKRLCHSPEYRLDETFPRLLEKLPVALDIVDGVFALERGPFHSGRAYRKNLLIVSPDPYAADAVAAQIIGYDVKDVPHLKFCAERYGRSTELSDMEIRGENVADHKTFLDWDVPWTEDGRGPIGFEKRGIKGLAYRKDQYTVCTGCTKIADPILIMMMGAFKGEPFEGIEILCGKSLQASPGFKKTVLLGKCSCEVNEGNPNIQKAIAIKSCPASVQKFRKLMAEEGLELDYEHYVGFRNHHFNRYAKDPATFDMGLYS